MVTELIPVNGLNNRIAQIEAPEEAKDLYDKLQAIKSAFKGNRQQQNEYAWGALEVARKGGFLLKEDNRLGRKGRGGNQYQKVQNSHDAISALPDGFTLSDSSRWQALTLIPQEEWERFGDKRLGESDKEITMKDALKLANRFKRKEKEEPNLEDIILPPEIDLRIGDFSEVVEEIQSGLIDIIITDPPYPKQYVYLYGLLAEQAKRILKPGGSLLAMCPHLYLPEILNLMMPHLDYHWVLSYQTPGGQSPQIWPRKVNTFWKPVLWFTNGEYTGDWQGDVIKSDVNDNDKRFHHWGQSESGMARLVERFSEPGDIVLDPFLGGGTTGVVALALGRQFIGIDISEEAIRTSKKRINELEGITE